jgi:hypothetical protein
MIAVIGLSFPSYIFWLSKGCPNNFVFFERSSFLGNWSSIEYDGHLLESSCHILSLPNKKTYKLLNKLNFNLKTFEPQPQKYDYLTNQFHKYFNRQEVLYYLKNNFQNLSFSDLFQNLTLYHEKFYYFQSGSFEVLKNNIKPEVIKQKVDKIVIKQNSILINGIEFQNIYLTPGSVFDSYNHNGQHLPFKHKIKKSIHFLVYIPKVNYNISYLRILNHNSLFRISKANYNNNDFYLISSDWNIQISYHHIKDFFERINFCEHFEIVKQIDSTDKTAVTIIRDRKIKYIYRGEKNLMNAVSQIL